MIGRTFAMVAVAGVVLLVALGLWLRARTADTHQPGEVYWRAPVADSQMTAVIRQTAVGAAPGELLIAALAYRIRVRLERVGPCADIMDHYDDLPVPETPIEAMRAMVAPVPLYANTHSECFSYHVVFDVPVDTAYVPFTMAMVHPAEDLALLYRE